ncbi:MAG: T9SS type A sorting domain-containing protein [Candidatus Cloacimonetes bacterium]|nr:T9SS type A sorting domain-containing protein [Candidatus Cloacimonadota bacterium]
MNRWIIVITLLFCVALGAYNWNIIGPSGIDVLNYRITMSGEIFSATSGFYYYDGTNWQSDSYGNLPVKDFQDFNGVNLLITGDGSDSDGVYTYDFPTNTFAIQEWVLNPHFMEQHGTNWWVGSDEGLDTSTDGLNWNTIATVGNNPCYDIAIQGDTLVVGTTTHVYISFDNGVTWTQGQDNGNQIHRIAYHIDGKLYGIYPGSSWSSGLYSSTDHGDTWVNEFWSINMTDVYSDYGILFVCWNQGQPPDIGVAQWDPLSQVLTSMSGNLPHTDVNRLTENMIINCPNLVACTIDGAWMTTDLTVGSNPVDVPPLQMDLWNYPNPFNPETYINFALKKAGHVLIDIYNAKGQHVSTLINADMEAGSHSVVWDGKNESGRSVKSGVYFYRMKSGRYTSTKKMILLK